MKTDRMLEYAIAVALGVGDKTDGRLEYQITLSVSGLLITGQIISGRDFMQSVDSFTGVEDSFTNEPVEGTPLKPIDTGFIHLKNARLFQGGQSVPPSIATNSGSFWRIKTESVDGFSLSFTS
jgi:hypothetical protein